MQLSVIGETMNFQINTFDAMEAGTTFIGTEIFPAVLHSMLDEVEAKGFSNIVSWQPHGRCFVVKDRKLFVAFIMPSFFRMSKFASFQRQLNLYDFKRITAGPDKGGYYHKNFVQGRKGLCKLILRQQVKGALVHRPVAELQPEFYPSLRRYEAIRNEALQCDAIMGQFNANKAFHASPTITNSSLVAVGLSNIPSCNFHSVGQQRYFNDFDVRGDHSSLLAAGATPKVERYGWSAQMNQSEHGSDMAEDYNTDSESARYARCEETNRMMRLSEQEQEGSRVNGSMVSMLCPSRCTQQQTTHIITMNHPPARCTANEQNRELPNLCFRPYSTGSFTGQPMAAPTFEEDTFGTAACNEGRNKDWIPQSAFY